MERAIARASDDAWHRPTALTFVLALALAPRCPVAAAEAPEAPPAAGASDAPAGVAVGDGAPLGDGPPLGDGAPLEGTAPPAGAAEPAPSASPRFANRPRLSFGYGTMSYREHDVDVQPGLESDFSETVFEGSIGWEFLVLPHHAARIDLGFWHTTSGEEEWERNGTLIQDNDLKVWRLSLEAGYLASTWDRGLPPRSLQGADRFIRFGGGFNLYYRHQHFTRDDFFLHETTEEVDQEVNELFDLFGGEAVLDLEAGPREIAAVFVRGKGGGGFATVFNDFFEDLDEDARFYTWSVQGSIEAGVLSQPIDAVELRVGYRFHYMEVFGDKNNVAGGTLELPDNTTEMHLIFLEANLYF